MLKGKMAGGSPILAFAIIAFMILWVWSKKTGKTIKQIMQEIMDYLPKQEENE